MSSPRSGLDWLFEGLSATALLGAGWDLATHWSALPARIPTHFGASGNPNGWGGKDSLLLLLGTTAGMFILLTIAESYQRLINIPIKVDRESPAVRQLLRSMVIAMKAVITVAFAWIVNLTIRTALGQADGLGVAFLPLFLAGILGPVVFYVVKLKKL